MKHLLRVVVIETCLKYPTKLLRSYFPSHLKTQNRGRSFVIWYRPSSVTDGLKIWGLLRSTMAVIKFVFLEVFSRDLQVAWFEINLQPSER